MAITDSYFDRPFVTLGSLGLSTRLEDYPLRIYRREFENWRIFVSSFIFIDTFHNVLCIIYDKNWLCRNVVSYRL